jgi:lysozyme
VTVQPGASGKPQNKAAIIAACCAIAAPMVIAAEGWVKVGYRDPIGIVTSCVGHTGAGAELGRHYSDEECKAQLQADLARHAQEIDACIKVDLPLKSRAAFTSFAFNVGAAAFCSSTLDRKLNAGDLVGACAELSRWTKAAGRVLPGLVTRRKTERALCEAGLTSP